MRSAISRRTFLRSFTTGLAAAVLAPAACSRSRDRAHPNIIFLMADDMGYGDVGCQSVDEKIPTPNMDRLASRGIRFTDAHSGSAVCTPTRYGVLTGRYAWRTRLKSGVLWGYSRPLIDPDRMTVASLLKQHGYFTGAIGKWHLGLGWQTKPGQPGPWESGEANESRWTGEHIDFRKPLTGGPVTAGFDYAYVIPASLDMAPYCYIHNDRVETLPTAHTEQNPPAQGGFWRAGPIAPDFRFPEVLPTLTDKAVNFIHDHAREPFFLYFPLTAPHRPIAPADFVKGKSRAGDYGDFVVEVDWTVGRVLQALDENGLADNTLIIVTSDNGSPARSIAHPEPYGIIGEFGHYPNAHWRGVKADIWDGGHRIPFLARWPGHIPAGAVSDQTICLTDLLRTAAAVVGDSLPAEAGEDSYNILPALLNPARQSPIREATVHHSLDGMFAVRQGPWKLILGRGSGGFTHPRRIQPGPGEPAGQLYNLDQDPAEETNLYQDRPEVVRQLTDLLHKYQREGRSVAPNPTP